MLSRAKDNMNYRRLYSRQKDKDSGVIYDQIIMQNNFYASRDYPQKMRRIKFKDAETGKILVFITNNFNLTANEVHNCISMDGK